MASLTIQFKMQWSPTLVLVGFMTSLGILS